MQSKGNNFLLLLIVGVTAFTAGIILAGGPATDRLKEKATEFSDKLADSMIDELPLERLEKSLCIAVEKENYERAAKIRDAISKRKIKTNAEAKPAS